MNSSDDSRCLLCRGTGLDPQIYHSRYTTGGQDEDPTCPDCGGEGTVTDYASNARSLRKILRSAISTYGMELVLKQLIGSLYLLNSSKENFIYQLTGNLESTLDDYRQKYENELLSDGDYQAFIAARDKIISEELRKNET